MLWVCVVVLRAVWNRVCGGEGRRECEGHVRDYDLRGGREAGQCLLRVLRKTVQLVITTGLPMFEVMFIRTWVT